MSFTPLRALLRQAQERPQGTAFFFHDEMWTYRRLADDSERIACGLAANDVRPGDRVVLHLLNRPELVVAYFACFRLGAIATPLRPAFTFSELADLLKRLQPALYIGEVSLYSNIAPADTAILPIARRILVDDHAGAHAAGSWDALKQAAPMQWPTPSIREPAVLINTSGTTSGRPKFVAHSPSTLAAISNLICRNDGLTTDDISVSPLAMAHASGIFRSLAFVELGVPFVLRERFDADAVLDYVEHYRGTYLSGPPAHYAALLRAQRARPRDLSSLRFGTIGGDSCPVDLQQEATSVLGAPLYNYWASTETVGSLTFGLRAGPVARVAPQAQIRLVDDQGTDVPHGAAGELLIRGPNVFIGYWGDPAATGESLRDGWYYTGDVMRRGDGDELQFVARKKDVIVRGATNISPIEVEDALLASHPAVKEAAVVGKADRELGQRVFAFVTLKSSATPTTVSEILAGVQQRLADYKVPEALFLLDELPRNALSKLDRAKLQAKLYARCPD